MKSILFILSLFLSTTVTGQVLNLEEIEYSVENIDSEGYKGKLEASGFELIEEGKEGKSGIYEKWVRTDNTLFITIQHNKSFKFTKFLVSSAEASSKSTIRNLLDEVSRNYSKKTIDDRFYYLSEDNPELTIHIVDLENNNTSVEGVIFFRKF